MSHRKCPHCGNLFRDHHECDLAPEVVVDKLADMELSAIEDRTKLSALEVRISLLEERVNRLAARGLPRT